MSESGQPVLLSDWLESRQPRPPGELSNRLVELTGDVSCTEAEIPESLLRIAQSILPSVGNDRAYAADLLAADALITYAMEAAAASPHLDAIASDAMQRLSALE